VLDESAGAGNDIWLDERLGVLEVCVEEVLNRQLVGVFGRVDVLLQALAGSGLDRFEKLFVLGKILVNDELLIETLVASLIGRVKTNQVSSLAAVVPISLKNWSKASGIKYQDGPMSNLKPSFSQM
jgi:hypothetical protein